MRFGRRFDSVRVHQSALCKAYPSLAPRSACRTRHTALTHGSDLVSTKRATGRGDTRGAGRKPQQIRECKRQRICLGRLNKGSLGFVRFPRNRKPDIANKARLSRRFLEVWQSGSTHLSRKQASERTPRFESWHFRPIRGFGRAVQAPAFQAD